MFEIDTIKMKNNKRFGKIYRLPGMMRNKFWLCIDYDHNPDRTITFKGLISVEPMENIPSHSTYFVIEDGNHNKYYFDYSNQNIKYVNAIEARYFEKVHELNPIDIYKIYISTAVYNYDKEISTVKCGKTYEVEDMVPGAVYHIAQDKHITNKKFICVNTSDIFPIYASGYIVTGEGKSKKCIPTILYETDTAGKRIIGKAIETMSYSEWLIMFNARYNRNDKLVPEITLK